MEDASASAISASTLSLLAARVSTPPYDRSELRRSVVHIGVGGFHRSHLATYVDDIARQGDQGWGIVGVGVLPSDERMAAVFERQDCLYTLISRGADESEVTIVGSIVEYLHVIDDYTPLIDRLAHSDTQIVSMTITEAGYPVDDESGEFVPERSAPAGVFALLAQGMERRRESGSGRLTVMSCDNIVANGRMARTATLGAAAAISPGLAEWVDANVRFPNSMVDRITPSTTPSDIEWLEREHGVIDGWPVVAEPFRQWVIEDDFGGDRLPLESIDVIVTDDIEPYELTKLRLLNAGHSCLAYLAALDGYVRVDEAMADPVLRAFVTALLHEEVEPTLPRAAGIDVDDYIDTLIERFSNPAVGDQIARLCQDGTAKFPKFLLPTIRARLESGGTVARAALALAGWCEYLATSENPSSDPRLGQAVGFAQRSLVDPGSFLDFADVFGTGLADSDHLRAAFAMAVRALRADGVQSTVRQST